MSSDFVDAQAAREGDSTLEILALLVVEDLRQLLSDEGINSQAHLVDIGTGNALLDGEFQSG